jgi:uncharacterized protein (DUF488 family)
MSIPVFTVGHSTQPADKFRSLLAQHQVTAVADVRSSPYSRLHPHFNREKLRDDLQRERIAYVFLGEELGARSKDPACYVDGKVQYARLAQTRLFQEGLDRVVAGARRYRIALLCAEKDPLTCHRCILVARHLLPRQLDVQHILADGRLESHADALARLLRELRLQERELFRGGDELIEEAYRLRGEEIAYVAKDPTVSEPVLATR